MKMKRGEIILSSTSSRGAGACRLALNRRMKLVASIDKRFELKEGQFKMIFRLGELFCGPGGLACGAKTAGSIMAHGGARCFLPHYRVDLELFTHRKIR